jgi:hypothetical protein
MVGDCWRDKHLGKTTVKNGFDNRGIWKMNSLKLISGVLALGFWFSSFFVWKYFDAHGLGTSDPNSGKIYPSDTHGSIVYLTSREHYFLYGLIFAGIVFLLFTIVFYYVGSKRP